jgi:hypothetical protein
LAAGKSRREIATSLGGNRFAINAGTVDETCHGVRLYTSTMVDGRKVPLSMYSVGRWRDGRMQTSAKPHNAALVTEALAKLLVTK